MDFFTTILIISFIAGAGLIVYSVVNFHGDEREKEDIPFARLTDKLEAFDETLSEADSVIAEWMINRVLCFMSWTISIGSCYFFTT